MKHIITLSVVLFCTQLSAQNIGINVNGAAPHQSALLDINADALPGNGKRGLLIPGVQTSERNLIIGPAFGLLVFNRSDTCIQFFDGINWSECLALERKCPSGFTRVSGSNFSIEVNERILLDWFAADSVCMSIGTRLCTWGEWYFACINQSGTTPTIQNILGDYEWLDDSGTGTSVRVAGPITCKDRSNIAPESINPSFRCCCGP